MLPLEWIKLWPERERVTQCLFLSVVKSTSLNCAMLRIFRNRIFVHDFVCLAGGLDAPINNAFNEFATSLGYETDDQGAVAVNSLTGGLNCERDFVNNKIHELTNRCLKQYNFLSDALEGAIIVNIMKEYRGQKNWQIAQFVPVFNKKFDKPVDYCGEPWIMQHLTKNIQSKIVIEFNCKIGRALKTFAKNAKKNLQSTLKSYEFSDAMLLIQNDDLNVIRFTSPANWSEPEITNYLKLIQKSLSKRFKNEYPNIRPNDVEMAETETDFLIDSDPRIYFCVNLKKDPNPIEVQETVLRLSETEPSLVRLHIPEYGYTQGFSEGELDTGNASSLIPLDYEADDEDDFDEDDDEELEEDNL